MLSFYTNPRSATYGHWAASSLQAAVSLCKGLYCAHVLRRLVRAFIADRTVLPINPYGYWSTTMLENEDLAQEIRLHLQELGNDMTADKLVRFLSTPDIKDRYGITRTITRRTAEKYIKSLGYRWQEAVKGQYVDGHERVDVVRHRDKVYIPSLRKVCVTCSHSYSDS